MCWLIFLNSYIAKTVLVSHETLQAYKGKPTKSSLLLQQSSRMVIRAWGFVTQFRKGHRCPLSNLTQKYSCLYIPLFPIHHCYDIPVPWTTLKHQGQVSAQFWRHSLIVDNLIFILHHIEAMLNGHKSGHQHSSIFKDKACWQNTIMEIRKDTKTWWSSHYLKT